MTLVQKKTLSLQLSPRKMYSNFLLVNGFFNAFFLDYLRFLAFLSSFLWSTWISLWV